MITRRQFLKYSAAGTAGLLFPWGGAGSAVSHVYAQTPQIKKFIDPLIAPIPVLTPDASTLDTDYYTITMSASSHKFHSQFVGKAATWRYGDMPYLGPTIEAKSGRRVIVNYSNNLPDSLQGHPLYSAIDLTIGNGMYNDLPNGRAVAHLHGGFTEPNSDGHPDDWFLPGISKTFTYSNQQPAAMLWYHDHAMGITRLNVYAGLAGLYFIRDEFDTGDENNKLGLPSGKYEIPLVIQDKTFTATGALFYPTVGITDVHKIWVPEFFGDTPVINAVAYPYLNVEPRRYRFRMVNGSQARFYDMEIAGQQGAPNLPFWVIGMEQSLLPAPVKLTRLVLAPGERADVIVDFTGVKPGTSYILTNKGKTPYPGGGKRAGANIPQLMKFNVNLPLDKTVPNAKIAPSLFAVPAPDPTKATKTRQIIMKETMDPVAMAPIHVRLNELWFTGEDDTMPKAQQFGVTEKIIQGATEVWQFVNLTVDAHPMHLHLVKFQVLNRQAFNVAAFTTAYMAWVGNRKLGPDSLCTNPEPKVDQFLVGAPILPAPEEAGWKDTVKALPGQVTRIIATFDLPPDTKLPAEYVYHCHILEHEENEMMRPFQVVQDPNGAACAAANAPAANGAQFPVPPSPTPMP